MPLMENECIYIVVLSNDEQWFTVNEGTKLAFISEEEHDELIEGTLPHELGKTTLSESEIRNWEDIPQIPINILVRMLDEACEVLDVEKAIEKENIFIH